MPASTTTATKRAAPGCWTCKVRRKKCDLKTPVCDACSTLQISCHNQAARPSWMDYGPRQDEMAESLKSTIRENAYRRRGERAVNLTTDRSGKGEFSSGEWTMMRSQSPRTSQPDVSQHGLVTSIDPPSSSNGPPTRLSAPAELSTSTQEPMLRDRVTGESFGFGRSDTLLMTFYLESVFPFQYPFYRPSILDGGRAWLLEMILSSPVVRQAMLCQSSYYLSLVRGTAKQHSDWENVLAQTEESFSILGRALKFLHSSGLHEHLHGAVHILTSILQLERFEIAIWSFGNCQAHLVAATALFEQLLECGGRGGAIGAAERFDSVLSQLGPPSWSPSNQNVAVPSAQRAALRFSSSLLLFDDTIASTILQERPRLQDYHSDLLCKSKGETGTPVLDLQDVIGIQNWVVQRIGEIAELDAWKQDCIKSKTLDVMQLAQRGKPIDRMLTEQLAWMDREPSLPPKEGCLLFASSAMDGKSPKSSHDQIKTMTRIWAYAAHIYLAVVISGWQPASPDISNYVKSTLDILTPDTARSFPMQIIAWPFAVAGCLAEPDFHASFRQIGETVPALSMFGTVRKALGVMESVWKHQVDGTAIGLDISACFRMHDEMVLLV